MLKLIIVLEENILALGKSHPHHHLEEICICNLITQFSSA